MTRAELNFVAMARMIGVKGGLTTPVRTSVYEAVAICREKPEVFDPIKSSFLELTREHPEFKWWFDHAEKARLAEMKANETLP